MASKMASWTGWSAHLKRPIGLVSPERAMVTNADHTRAFARFATRRGEA
jgi:hypothetical protein